LYAGLTLDIYLGCGFLHPQLVGRVRDTGIFSCKMTIAVTIAR